jgi:hypothetical protein
MNEQQILANIMKNPAYREAFRRLLIEDKDLARAVCPEQNNAAAYIWCAEMTDQNTGIVYYHPVVIPQTGMSMDMGSLMDVNNYTMMVAFNQFEAYDHEPMVKMFTSVYGDRYPIRLISVPEETYVELAAALTSLVTAILSELEQCFDHLDSVARMSNTDATMLKVRLIGSVFGNMTTVAACFDREMNVVDSEDHDYHVEVEEDEDCDEEECDDDWIDDDY